MEGVVAASESIASGDSILAVRSCLSFLGAFKHPWRPYGCELIPGSDILSEGMGSFGRQAGESRTVEGVPVASDASEAALGDDGKGAL